jgi:hypothetical protein
MVREMECLMKVKLHGSLENELGRRSAAKLLSKDEARRITANHFSNSV